MSVLAFVLLVLAAAVLLTALAFGVLLRLLGGAVFCVVLALLFWF